MKKVMNHSKLVKLVFVGILCFLGHGIQAQYSIKTEPVTAESLKKAEQILKPSLKMLSFSHLDSEHCYLPTLGLFCVLENKIEKKANFPVKMRLGSIDYVNKLENKHN